MQIALNPSPNIDTTRDLVPRGEQDASFSSLLDQVSSSLPPQPGLAHQPRSSADVGQPRTIAPEGSDHDQDGTREPEAAEALAEVALLNPPSSPSTNAPSMRTESPSQGELPKDAATALPAEVLPAKNGVSSRPQATAAQATAAAPADHQPASPSTTRAVIDPRVQPQEARALARQVPGVATTANTASGSVDDTAVERPQTEVRPAFGTAREESSPAGATSPRSRADLSLEDSLNRFRSFKPASLEVSGRAADTATAPPAAPLMASQPGLPGSSPASSSSEVPSAALTEQVGDQEWTNSLATRLTGLGNTPGVRTLELSLNPAELGPLSVSLSVDTKSQAVLSLQMAHPQTRKALDDSLDKLREAFSERGLTLVQVQLVERPSAAATTAQQQNGAQPQFSQNGDTSGFAGQQQAFQQGSGQRPDSPTQPDSIEAAASAGTTDEQATGASQQTPRLSGGVDLFA
ncbi:flagellar hook-length control protein FliK [Halotalea alkalilenta]|uniref:flagellar hook-length control protein FliK n=1 Tax=Halotalea alkalilenta TaxID=376489 RepID=UPI00047FB159|nr:flagellar hook-length control protein FliK [Halotalea alkalilenta]